MALGCYIFKFISEITDVSLTFVDNTLESNNREETTANCRGSNGDQDNQPKQTAGIAPRLPLEELLTDVFDSHRVL